MLSVSVGISLGRFLFSKIVSLYLAKQLVILHVSVLSKMQVWNSWKHKNQALFHVYIRRYYSESYHESGKEETIGPLDSDFLYFLFLFFWLLIFKF